MIVGEVHIQGAPPIELTEDDALWMARSVLGEEGARASEAATVAIVSCMVRRLAMLARNDARAGRAVYYASLTELVRGKPGARNGYSTPVQHWRELTPQRAHVQSIAWADIPDAIRVTTLRVLSGRMPLSQAGTGVVHFAAPSLVAQKLPANPDWRVITAPCANALVSDAQGRATPEPVVRGAGGTPSTFFALIVLLGAAIGAAT